MTGVGDRDGFRGDSAYEHIRWRDVEGSGSHSMMKLYGSRTEASASQSLMFCEDQCLLWKMT